MHKNMGLRKEIKMDPRYFKHKTLDKKLFFPFFNKHNLFVLSCGASVIFFIVIIFLRPGNSFAKKTITFGKDPAIEQQIDIQDSALSTTSSTYTDASGSGSFLWNSARYASLAHVYFEAGIAKNGAVSTTK